MLKVAEGAIKVPSASVNAPFTVNELAAEALIVPVYPVFIASDETVGAISTVQFFVLVESNRAPPVETGAVSPDQFALSDQLLVDPPPSQILDTPTVAETVVLGSVFV